MNTNVICFIYHNCGFISHNWDFLFQRWHRMGKLYLPWHSWIIRVLYMEITYSEPQTPLFPPSYVNPVNKKDHWKIGESEHNTDCGVTVGITNSYAPNICIIYTCPCSRPAASRQPNHQKFCRYCDETSGDNFENGRSWKLMLCSRLCRGCEVQGWVGVCIQKGMESK